MGMWVLPNFNHILCQKIAENQRLLQSLIEYGLLFFIKLQVEFCLRSEVEWMTRHHKHSYVHKELRNANFAVVICHIQKERNRKWLKKSFASRKVVLLKIVVEYGLNFLVYRKGMGDLLTTVTCGWNPKWKELRDWWCDIGLLCWVADL